jgi:hypothetical protein
MKRAEVVNLDKLFSWCRYLFWADILYQRYIEHHEQTDELAATESLTFALASQWLNAIR